MLSGCRIHTEAQWKSEIQRAELRGAAMAGQQELVLNNCNEILVKSLNQCGCQVTLP